MPDPNPIEGGKELASKKAGPLPLWGWAIAVVAVGGVVYYVFIRNAGGASATAPGAPTGALPPVFGGGGGGGGTAADPAAGVVAKLTNAQWLQQAVTAAEAAIPGLRPGQASLYLIEYLSGTRPQGGGSAGTLYDKVVGAAKGALGDAPNPASSLSVNVNPFTNNISWWQNARGFLGGAPGNVVNELTNLFYGTVTQISPAAAAALDDLRGVLGGEPLPISFTIAGSGPPAPPATPAAPDFGAVFSLARIEQLFGIGAREIAAHGPSYVNDPANYLPNWRLVFPELNDDQIRAAAEATKQAFRVGLLDAANIDRDLYRQIVIAASQGRNVVPASPAPAGPAQISVSDRPLPDRPIR